MAGRLGQVLYGIGLIWAAIFAGFGVWGAVNPSAGGGDLPGTFLVLMLLIGAVGYGVGWACRFVLAGR